MTSRAVAVIGAGHAGLSAATAAAGFGLDSLLFEQFTLETGLPPTVRRYERTTVWGLFPGWTVAASRDGDPVTERVEAVILATGSHDRAAPFAGGSQPGVITAGAVHRLIAVHCLLPGQRFVVVGDGEDAGSAIETIEAVGGEVVLRVPEEDVRRMTAYGAGGIERVELDGSSVDADIVVMAAGRSPDVLLAAMAGCELIFEPATGAWVVRRHGDLESTVSGIWIAGDIAGCTDTATAESEGRYAAARIAHRLGAIDDVGLSRERVRFEGGVSPERRMAGRERRSVRQPWTPELMS